MRTTKELDFIETNIPKLANSATKKAYVDALSAGLSVTKTIGDRIFEVYPDGTKKFIKDIKPSIKIKRRVFTI